MLRKLYDWTLGLAQHPKAVWGLAIISFLESSVFPIPPDILLAPMVLANRLKAWTLALIATLSSVAGGLLGYAIGAWGYVLIAEPLINFYGYGDYFAQFSEDYKHWGLWIVLVAGLTPFPYKIITIASGVVGLSLPLFILSSLVARGMRFFAVAALLFWFGPAIRAFVERWLGWVFFAFLILLLAGFWFAV